MGVQGVCVYKCIVQCTCIHSGPCMCACVDVCMCGCVDVWMCGCGTCTPVVGVWGVCVHVVHVVGVWDSGIYSIYSRGQ